MYLHMIYLKRYQGIYDMSHLRSTWRYYVFA